MNYTTLKADVADYLHRTDLTTQIPTFIEHARRRLGRELRALCNQATGSVTSFTNYRTSLPANIAALIGVWQDDLELAWVPAAQVAGYSDGVYSVDGGDLIVPGAGTAATVDLSYWVIPAALSGGTDVSEGMDELPDLWRCAALEEAAVYLRDWDLADRMHARVAEIILFANRAATDARFGAGAAVHSATPGSQRMARL